MTTNNLSGSAGVGSPSEASSSGNSRTANVRHSIDGSKLFQDAGAPSGTVNSPVSKVMSSPGARVVASPTKLPQSYSAGEIPTSGNSNGGASLGINTNHHAQQHLNNHNANMGRIPASVVSGRHSRDMSADSAAPSTRETVNYPSITSTLHASAPSFGPAMNQPQMPQQPQVAAGTPGAPPAGPAIPYPYYPPAPGYPPMAPAPPAAYNALPMLMQNMSIASGSAPAVYPPAQAFTGYNPLYAQPSTSRPQHDSQARVIQSRRQMDNEGKFSSFICFATSAHTNRIPVMARYNNLPLEQVGGSIYSLCKDQHGCRYLQKQLENRIPEQIHMIWLETNQHVVELMTDPFGNYLCQKLLELCNDEERTVLIQNAAPSLVSIALNQHGTRALQKMIEHVTTQVQINLIVEALRNQVVELIQDLNGNHVIQKCLNKLSAADASFIFDAVGNHCIEVGTHRHGCCVLQRCIDHADGSQKVWLVERITENAVALVQDPFGNYVVQYIIDLNEESFTEPLVEQFLGRIVQLSKHKFSSNVVEKCLRCSSESARERIVNELLAPGEIDRLLRDSFGNYVIQTALDYAPFNAKQRLVEAIRPLLPSIRATPYGRRIQAKIQAFDARANAEARAGGPITQTPTMPTDPVSGQISMRTPNGLRAMAGHSIAGGAYTNGTNGVNGTGSSHGIMPMVNLAPPRQDHQSPPAQTPPRGQHPSPQRSTPGAAENGENPQWV
jgi:hypothetical protein